MQPLDVGSYGSLQRIYDNYDAECHKTIGQISLVIT
jgi:hypothetical protein